MSELIAKFERSRFIIRFKQLWSLKVFRYSLIVHILYYLISIYLTLTFFPEKNDFLVYYKVGRVFLVNPTDLYNPANYNWPFRYFPLSTFLFIPYSLMDFNLGFIIFNLINLILNYLICFMLYKLIKITIYRDQENNENKIIKYICFYLISLPQILNYILGQINLYLSLLILISLYFFIKGHRTIMDLLAGFILGLSVIIKPITILMIPFLILIHYDYNEKKLKVIFAKSIFRLIGVVLPISLNLLMFINIPGLLDGFINVNLTGADTLIPNHSFSITKIVSNLFIYIGLPLNSTQVLAIFLSMTIALGIIGFIAYILIRISKISIIYGYVISLLIMLLAYFDSWDHHLLNLLPLLIIIIFTNPQTSQIIKVSIRPSFFFLCFLDLAFMGLFWLLNPSSSNLLFPFNFVPTIFLAYTFYGIIKICIKKP